jgi:uncharacterized protein (DUF2141 family)
MTRNYRGLTMHNLYQFFAITIALFALTSATAFAAQLKITVEDMRDAVGRVAIAVYDSDAGFPDDDNRAVKRLFVTLEKSDQPISLTIKDLPAGQYAVALFHDADLSGKLEKNFFGIPRKGYGFSNNVNPSLRSANFEEAVFTLPESGLSLTIKMIYR